MSEYENINGSVQDIPHRQEVEQPCVPPQENTENTPVYTAEYPAAPQYTQAPEPKEKKKRPWALIAAVALCCSVLGSALGAGGVFFAQKMQEEKLAEEVPP